MTEQNPDFSELIVPDEPGLWCCWRHRKVQTRLRCGRCEKPICPKCTRMGPTGSRCLECASNRTQHIYQVSPVNYAATFAAALIFSLVGVAIIGSVGIFLLFLIPLIGPALTRFVVVVTGGKRGTGLAATASLGALLGAGGPLMLKWRAMQAMMDSAAPELAGSYSTAMLTDAGFVLLFLVILIPALWHWIK